jgi:predicted enzyme related to lactoylglutathione lyase
VLGLDMGGVGLVVDGRDDLAAVNPEPGRIILDLATDDAPALVARLDALGVRWVAHLEEREHGWFATLADPEGNYAQVLQTNDAYRRAAGPAYSGFAVDDLAAASAFYGGTLGLPVARDGDLLMVTIAPGTDVLVCPKPDHVPAGFTILNLPVADIDVAVDDLAGRGMRFLPFDGVDERGIARGPGPATAWFTDPAGNIMSVLQE